MNKVLLISNLYPSKEAPYKGSFVKNIFDFLSKKQSVEKVVLSNKGNKLLNYCFFYVNSICKLICKKNSLVYVHYVSHSIIPCLFAKFIKSNLNVIINFHGSDLISEENSNSTLNFIKSYLCKKGVEISSKVIVPSEYYKRLVLEQYNIDDSLVFVSPSGGVDLSIFYPKNDKDFFYDFVLSGRLEEDKGIFTFLNSIKLLVENFPNIKVYVCGSGSKKVDVEAYIRNNKLINTVSLTDGVAQEDLFEVYNSLKFFVFPSQRKSESLGLVGLEAMACGCPTIACDDYGPASYVTNQNGFLFKTGIVGELTNAMKESLLLSEYDYAIKVQKSIKLASKYESHLVLQNLENEIMKNL